MFCKKTVPALALVTTLTVSALPFASHARDYRSQYPFANEPYPYNDPLEQQKRNTEQGWLKSTQNCQPTLLFLSLALPLPEAI